MLTETLTVASPAKRWNPFRWLGRVEWLLLLAVGLLTAAGIINLAGAAQSAEITSEVSQYWLRQVQWLWLAVPLMLVLGLINYRWLLVLSPFGYLLGMGLTVLTYKFGRESHGQALWLELPGVPIAFQPAEFCKITTLLMLAAVLSWRRNPIRTLWDLILPGAIAFVPFTLVLVQGDTGTASVYVPMVLAMCYAAGFGPGRMIALLSIGLGVMGVGGSMGWSALWLGLSVSVVFWMIAERMRPAEIIVIAGLNLCLFMVMFTWFDEVWGHMKAYQRERLVAFWDPDQYADTGGWQYRQSLIAVGSGGVWGKGWGQGTQSKMKFLPEFHTDFVYATLTEEWGLVGGSAVLGLLAFYLWRIVAIGTRSRAPAGAYLAAGIAAMTATHIFINVGMNLGVMPITGLPLTFLSYGGSFLVTNFAAAGLLLSVWARRDVG